MQTNMMEYLILLSLTFRAGNKATIIKNKIYINYKIQNKNQQIFNESKPRTINVALSTHEGFLFTFFFSY